VAWSIYGGLVHLRWPGPSLVVWSISGGLVHLRCPQICLHCTSSQFDFNFLQTKKPGNKLRSNCGKSSKKAKKVCKDPPNSSSAKNRGVKRSRDKSKDTFEKEEDQPAEKKSKLEIGAEEMGNEYHLQNGKKRKRSYR